MTREYRQTRFNRPAGATEILLVRHGESRAARSADPFPLVDGQGDPELHAEGRTQALRIGERLRQLPIRAVYITNLRRTAETAAPLCAHLGLAPVAIPELREIALGEWEGGLLRRKAHENDPLYRRVLAEQRWDLIPGAESWETVQARVMRGLARIVAAHPDELVAAVLHSGIIAHLLAHATGAERFAFNSVDNGSISRIVVKGERIVVRGFNDTAHLEPEATRP